MSGPEFGSGTSRKPTQAGLERWVDSIGAVTTPLLAGFSVSAVVVVSDDAANFRWPGAAILALAIAAVVLIAAVQCAYHARLYLSARSDMANAPVPDPRLRPTSGTVSTTETGAKSKPEVGTGPWRTSATIGRQLDDAYELGLAWTKWTQRAYHCGIVALLAGVALAIAPRHAAGVQGSLQWLATGIAFAACAGEALWIARQYWRARRRR